MAKTTERTWNTEDARIAPAIERIVAEDTYRKGVQTRTTRRLVENVGPAVAVLRFGVGMSQTDVSEALKTEGVATINQNTVSRLATIAEFYVGLDANSTLDDASERMSDFWKALPSGAQSVKALAAAARPESYALDTDDGAVDQSDPEAVVAALASGARPKSLSQRRRKPGQTGDGETNGYSKSLKAAIEELRVAYAKHKKVKRDDVADDTLAELIGQWGAILTTG